MAEVVDATVNEISMEKKNHTAIPTLIGADRRCVKRSAKSPPGGSGA